MATWNKLFSNFAWKNKPDISTPLGQTLLNRINNALNGIDDRVVTLKKDKADSAELNSLIADVRLDPATGVFTFIKYDGTSVTVDTALEEIVVNFKYNYETQTLDLILADGSKQSIDMSALITQNEFVDSATITLTADNAGKVKAEIKKGSIAGDYLEPNYLENVTTQANTALAASQSALESQSLAATSETNAATFATAASKSATAAATSEVNAAKSENAASASAKTASEKASISADSADIATQEAISASTSADSANASANTATQKAAEAAASAKTASEKANEALESSLASEVSAVRAEEAAEKAEAVVGLTIDDTLSETSVNPVQNKVITKAVNEIVSGDKTVGNALTLDGHGTEYFAMAEELAFPTSKSVKLLGIITDISELDNYYGENGYISINIAGSYAQVLVMTVGQTCVQVYMSTYGEDSRIKRIRFRNATAKWSDWFEFTNYLPIDGGGTVTSANDTPLTLKSNTVGANLRLMDSTGKSFYFGFASDGEPRITGKGFLLHTGNFANYAADVETGTFTLALNGIELGSATYYRAGKLVYCYLAGKFMQEFAAGYTDLSGFPFAIASKNGSVVDFHEHDYYSKDIPNLVFNVSTAAVTVNITDTLYAGRPFTFFAFYATN